MDMLIEWKVLHQVASVNMLKAIRMVILCLLSILGKILQGNFQTQLGQWFAYAR